MTTIGVRYAVVDTGSGFVIVSKVSDETGVRTYPRTKRQWNKAFLEKLVRGLNNDPASKAYKISLNVLRKYEFAI